MAERRIYTPSPSHVPGGRVIYSDRHFPDSVNPLFASTDQALTEARNTVVFTDRVKFYHQFLELLAQQVYIIPLYVGVNIMTVNKGLSNVFPNPNTAENMWNISGWWLAHH